MVFSYKLSDDCSKEYVMPHLQCDIIKSYACYKEAALSCIFDR